MSESPYRPLSFEFELDAARDQRSPQAGERLIPAHRTWEAAETQAGVLLRRLGVPEALAGQVLQESPEPALQELRNLLVQYASDFPMNIDWYQDRIRKCEQRLRWFQAAGIGSMVVLLGFFGGLIFYTRDATAAVDHTQQWAAELSLFGTLFYGLLKSMAMGTNVKSQLAAFWSASATLKEALFTFEHNWRGKLPDRAALLGQDFQTALFEELRNARAVVRQERTAFFDSYANPNDIFTGNAGVLSEVEGKVTGLLAARATVTEQRKTISLTTAQDIADTRRKLGEAKAKLGAATAALERAKASGLEDIATFERAVFDATTLVDELTRTLKYKLKVDRLNPG